MKMRISNNVLRYILHHLNELKLDELEIIYEKITKILEKTTDKKTNNNESFLNQERKRLDKENNDEIVTKETRKEDIVIEVSIESSKIEMNRKISHIELNELARNDLKKHSSVFSGLYESLYSFSQTSIDVSFRRNILTSIATRINNLDGASNLKTLWSNHFDGFSEWSDEEIMKKIDLILKFICECDIIREGRSDTIITVTDDTYEKYYLKDSTRRLYIGDKARILTPYWHLGSQILEKGIVDEVQPEITLIPSTVNTNVKVKDEHDVEFQNKLCDNVIGHLEKSQKFTIKTHHLDDEIDKLSLLLLVDWLKKTGRRYDESTISIPDEDKQSIRNYVLKTISENRIAKDNFENEEV